VIYLGNNQFETDYGIVDVEQFFKQFVEFLQYINEKQDYHLLELLDSNLKDLKLNLNFVPSTFKNWIEDEVKEQVYNEGYRDGYSDGYNQALYEEDLE
jgi:flagellar biosynthesis/type III secretory pathway protein FliH